MKTGGTQSAFAQSAKDILDDLIGSRKKVSLWLDLKITKEVETLEIIQRMKSKREFRKSVMVGLRIVSELRQGRVDTLLAEFPQVRELLQVKATAPTDDGAGRLERMESILEIIAANQKTGLTMASQPVQQPLPGLQPMTPKADTGKQIASPAFSLPTFEDDDDLPTVVTKKNESMNASANLIRSMLALH